MPSISTPGSNSQAVSGRGAVEGCAKNFLPLDFINFSMPYRHIDSGTWERTNNGLTLTMVGGHVRGPSGSHIMLPYGKYARAVVMMLGTEAKKTNSREIEIQHSYRGFMKQLGLSWSQRNAAEAIRQLQAFLATSISVTASETADDGRLNVRNYGFRVSSGSDFWFDANASGDLDRGSKSVVVLSEDFYDSLMHQRSVPINAQAWAHLINTTKSPMALDVYTWLSYRLHGLKKPQRISWQQIYDQFGSQDELKRFKAKFRTALVAAKEVYPEADIVEVGTPRTKGLQGFLLKMSKNALDTCWRP